MRPVRKVTARAAVILTGRDLILLRSAARLRRDAADEAGEPRVVARWTLVIMKLEDALKQIERIS